MIAGEMVKDGKLSRVIVENLEQSYKTPLGLLVMVRELVEMLKENIVLP